MTESFYWHDYETWGTNPAKDRPVQFAGQRTDSNFDLIGEPLVIYARPSNDLLPQPEACLITGITPQLAISKGLIEAEFISKIHTELSQPETCSAGYNSLRFDDEVTRYTLFRNFFDPYAREWRNGNSRWDLIDVVRMAHALRPDGIEWPQRDGRASFRLTDLTTINNIAHDAAHEALSDVHATINLARLLRERQPRLFKFALELRNKQRVKELLWLPKPQPLLHVSSKYKAELGCIAPILALTDHPTDRNGVLVVDLRADPGLLLDLDAEEIRRLLYTPSSALPEHSERIPLKTVHINRVPMLAPMSTLTAQAAERWNINIVRAQDNAARLQAVPELIAKLYQVVTYPKTQIRDPEQDLYGAFLSNEDQARCAQVRSAMPEDLGRLNLKFRDARLEPMFLRYRARNWPNSLNTEELQRWNLYRMQRLTDPAGGGSLTLEQYRSELTAMRTKHGTNAEALKIIADLEAWGDSIIV